MTDMLVTLLFEQCLYTWYEKVTDVLLGNNGAPLQEARPFLQQEDPLYRDLPLLGEFFPILRFPNV